jgi:hypothetical protein
MEPESTIASIGRYPEPVQSALYYVKPIRILFDDVFWKYVYEMNYNICR